VKEKFLRSTHLYCHYGVFFCFLLLFLGSVELGFFFFFFPSCKCNGRENDDDGGGIVKNLFYPFSSSGFIYFFLI